MTETSRRRSTTTYVAVAVSLLALLVAATSTAFAAGLAANSVGAKQLKKNAVTSKKIKSNAVTTAKIKRGSVTADRIASGVIPARTVHVSRQLPITATTVPLLRLAGLSFDAVCSTALQDQVEVSLTRTGGGLLTASGLFSLETSTTDATYPFVDQNTDVNVTAIAPSNDGFGAMTFDGVVTPAGFGPVKVQVTVQVDDGTVNPCQTFVTAMPIG